MLVEGVRILLMKPVFYVTFPAAGQAVSISFIKPTIMYVPIDSVKSPASGIATVSETRLMSQVGGSEPSCARVDKFVSEVGAVGMPVLLRAVSLSLSPECE